MNRLATPFFVSFFFCLGVAQALTPVRGSIAVQADLVHAEFEGRSNWSYDLKRNRRGGKTFIEVALDPLDETSLKQMSSFKSEFVKSVKLNPQGTDGKTMVSFELTGDDVESFDYLTDQPSRLVIDFYVTEAAKAKRASKSKKTKTANPDEKTSSEVVAIPARVARKPAGDTLQIADQGPLQAVSTEKGLRAGIFDGGDPDYDRFSVKDYEVKEEAILKAKDNYYLTFPMLRSPNESFAKIRAAAPIYSIAPKPDEENKMARLLLTLFERKRYSVYLKTLDWFKDKYPESKYNDLLAYMTGDVFLTRWDTDKNPDDYERAIQAFQVAVDKFPTAPPAERASFLRGLLALERGDTLSAIRAFDAHIRNANFGDGKVYSKDLARLGLGFSLMKLFHTEEAHKVFDDLEHSTSFPELRMEAASRKGDVESGAKNYAKAIEEYQRAMRTYPQSQNQFPGETYNLAEAFFQTGKYRQALDTYRDFIKRFPADGHAPFALTRMGETLEILGADPTRVVGAYLETYFRFGEDPKAIVARLRLLSARMKGMKPKEADNAVTEILSLAKKIELPNIEQFATILIADGYTSRGEHQKSIDLLSEFLQKNPTAPDLDTLKTRIVSNIVDKFRAEVTSGDFMTALKTHQKYLDSWLRPANRLDSNFYLGRAFEMSGVSGEAERLYKDVLNRIFAAKGTPDEKKLVLQHLPSVESIHLRLATVAANRKDLKGAYEELRLIKTPDKLSDVEQIDRVDLAVRLLESRGDTDSASRYLTELLKTWQGRPELVAEPYLRLAEIETKQGRKEDAIISLKKIDTLAHDSGKVPQEIHAKALENLGDLYIETKHPEKAIDVYADLLNQYEDKRPLASIRYRMGRLQFDAGNLQKAAEVWNQFKGDKADFWKDLAQEQLKNSEWRDGYKKYLKRIPAMAESREK